jgi:hypothetical protein
MWQQGVLLLLRAHALGLCLNEVSCEPPPTHPTPPQTHTPTLDIHVYIYTEARSAIFVGILTQFSQREW